jgi:hypothetical protein
MKTSRIMLWLIFGALPVLFSGCGKAGSSRAGAHDGSSEKTKLCFHCVGTGKVPCPNGKDGLMDCPGPCLKLSKGVWQHMDVEGHPPTDVWQKFTSTKGSQSWNQTHVGDVIEYQNGEPINTGKCKICGGKARVKCTVCNGTGEINCPICDGKKAVPESWTEFDNPKIKNRPEQITLKDGRVLIGKKIMVLGDSVTIRTATTNLHVHQSDIVSEQPQK